MVQRVFQTSFDINVHVNSHVVVRNKTERSFTQLPPMVSCCITLIKVGSLESTEKRQVSLVVFKVLKAFLRLHDSLEGLKSKNFYIYYYGYYSKRIQNKINKEKRYMGEVRENQVKIYRCPLPGDTEKGFILSETICDNI